MKVAVNNFVRRQSRASGKTYSDELSFEFFAKHAEVKLKKNEFESGYRDGVVIVKLDKQYVHKVFCPYVKITKDSNLIAKYVKRRPGEEPYIQVCSLNGKPLQAGSVSLILYRHDVLAENNEYTTNADWELISINAIPKGEKKMPIGPVTMMRNQLELNGGTKGEYSSEEWAYSVRFWQKYAPIEPNI
jgi:hypothetical protein